MKVNSAIETIMSELKFQARSAIIEKYSATDADISEDGFTYTVSEVVKYRHPYGAITTDVILSSIYREMIYLCVQTVPLSLLESKGGTASIVRNLNSTWDIRTPNYPVAGETLDIDEILAQIAIYRTLSYLGVSAYTANAKELLTTYKEGLVVPTEDEASDSLAFRFSSDGLEWHDTYQSGDMYFSIGRNAQWGNSIPIGGGGSSGGATKFIQLSDVPQTYSAGKILKANASGTGLVFADEQAIKKTFLELNDTPSTYVGGKFLAVNSAGSAVVFVDAPAGGSGQDALVGYQATMPYDFGTETSKQFITLDENTTFSVALNADGLTPKMEKDTIYHMQVYPSSYLFSFSDTQIKKPASTPAFTGSEYAIIFNMMWDGDDIFVFNINSYN